MNILLSAAAGIVQGLTEFLPISSTAHLTLFGRVFGLVDAQRPQEWTATIAVIQLGTLGAVIVYFRHELADIVLAFVRENITLPRRITHQGVKSKMAWMILIGTIPVIVFGLALKDTIEGPWTKNVTVIAAAQIVFAALLFMAEKGSKHLRSTGDIGWKDALVVGIGQACALVPGASRSGTTLTAALLLGIVRGDAARFSFLLSVPAVLLSGVFEFWESLPFLTSQLLISYLIGILTAFVSGYVSIALLLKFLKTHTTTVFVAYRIILGMVLLAIAI